MSDKTTTQTEDSTWEIYNDLYESTTVVSNSIYPDLHAYMLENWGVDLGSEWPSAEAMTYDTESETGGVVIVIWFNPTFEIKVPTIAHEAFHATVYSMDGVGVKFDVQNHEPYAYYMSWLTRKICNLFPEEEL